jgi:hypothetical protein
VEMYDPKTNIWTGMPSMMQRWFHFEGKIFAVQWRASG